MKEHRQQLRHPIIKHRSKLSIEEQVYASHLIAQQVLEASCFKTSKHIAFYMAINGEVNPNLILETALSHGKQCYLPILHPKKHNLLWFGQYHKEIALKANYLGILEPDVDQEDCIDPAHLDLVITPLVGFDAKGHRLGMGGGFYDRTFAFKAEQSVSKPILMGLGYHFQHFPQIPHQAWDIPLNLAVTDQQIFYFDASPNADE